MKRPWTVRSIPILAMLLGTIASVILNGCDRIQRYRRDAEWNRAEAEIGILNDGYMKGDLEGARQNLLKAERYLDQVHYKYLQARGQALNYDRLYALERAAGNADVTDVYLVKVKYWVVVDMELRHFTSEQIAAHLRSLTPDGVVNGILQWDRKAFTEGRTRNT